MTSIRLRPRSGIIASRSLGTAQPQTYSIPRSAASLALAEGKARLNKRRQEILAQTAVNLLAGRDPDREVMPQLLQALSAELEVDASLGYVIAEFDDVMRLAFIAGFAPDVVQRCLTLDFGQGVCGRVAATCQPMHVTDIQNTLDPIADIVRSAGINAYACEPLVIAGRLLGTLSFASRTRRSFDTDDLLFFRAIAKHVALARDRTRIGRIAAWAAGAPVA